MRGPRRFCSLAFQFLMRPLSSGDSNNNSTVCITIAFMVSGFPRVERRKKLQAPSSKLQAPEKLQEPSSNTTGTGRAPLRYRAGKFVGDWSSEPDVLVAPGRMRFVCSRIGGWELELLWSLELGLWSFDAAPIPRKRRAGVS